MKTDPTGVAVWLLGAALILSLCLIGAHLLIGDPARPIPDVLVATPPTCLAGLLGLLAPRPGRPVGGDPA
jgi:hypothetical protein